MLQKVVCPFACHALSAAKTGVLNSMSNACPVFTRLRSEHTELTPQLLEDFKKKCPFGRMMEGEALPQQECSLSKECETVMMKHSSLNAELEKGQSSIKLGILFLFLFIFIFIIFFFSFFFLVSIFFFEIFNNFSFFSFSIFLK
jgi:hypothetical protein